MATAWLLPVGFLCLQIGALGIEWPDRFDLSKQFEVLQTAGCSGFCALNGFGDGYVIGTAPFCDDSCETGCIGRACLSPMPGGSFMPDAGGTCLNTVTEAASEVFSGDTLPDKFKDLMMVKSKACCCQSLLPAQKSVTKTEPTQPGTVSCDDWCQGGGFGHGLTIGTAPICSTSCAEDCAGNVCATSNSFFSSHGNGCATGGKICCCAAKNIAPDSAEYWKEKIGDWWSGPPEPLPSPFSCADYCGSGGWGGGSVLGTAPFCGVSCESDCPGKKCVTVGQDDVTDYGKSCVSGNKVCCCDSGAASALLAAAPSNTIGADSSSPDSGKSISRHAFHDDAGLPADADGAAFLQMAEL